VGPRWEPIGDTRGSTLRLLGLLLLATTTQPRSVTHHHSHHHMHHTCQTLVPVRWQSIRSMYQVSHIHRAGGTFRHTVWTTCGSKPHLVARKHHFIVRWREEVPTCIQTAIHFIMHTTITIRSIFRHRPVHTLRPPVENVVPSGGGICPSPSPSPSSDHRSHAVDVSR